MAKAFQFSVPCFVLALLLFKPEVVWTDDQDNTLDERPTEETQFFDLGDSDNQEDHKFYYGTFPKGFIWGVATSAYQTEGAWDADGKGMSIWDTFCHTPGNIRDNNTGDMACDSYNKYEDDVRLISDMGAKVYRFSISWPRILPLGTTTVVNQLGIDFYNRMIDALLAVGVKPVVTLYHWDLPQALQDVGGWENEKIVEYFGDYARIIYSNFGDRVKLWITLNEPFLFSYFGYDKGYFAPGFRKRSAEHYRVVHNALMAHAHAYRIYQSEFASKQRGKVGITADAWWYEPADPQNPDDIEAAERAMQFRLGWIFTPLYTGQYPKVMREYIDQHSLLENRPESRLPLFNATWSRKLRGALDFVGINHYTSELVTSDYNDSSLDVDNPSWRTDVRTIHFPDSTWRTASSPWLQIVPWGMRKLLVWIKEHYNNPPVIITENGMSDKEGIKDTLRVHYFKGYINEMLKAIRMDNCNVIGYFAWSLLDVFEWDAGFTEKFGIHHVDFHSPNLTRTPKDSALFLKQVFADNGFPRPEGETGFLNGASTTFATSNVALSIIVMFVLNQLLL